MMQLNKTKYKYKCKILKNNVTISMNMHVYSKNELTVDFGIDALLYI